MSDRAGNVGAANFGARGRFWTSDAYLNEDEKITRAYHLGFRLIAVPGTLLTSVPFAACTRTRASVRLVIV